MKLGNEEVKLSKAQSKSLENDVDWNLRGLNTYNLIKRVIWSCVTNRPHSVPSSELQVNLPLLKGLLTEVNMELHVEDFLKTSGVRGHDTSYKEIDIYSTNDFDDYR